MLAGKGPILSEIFQRSAVAVESSRMRKTPGKWALAANRHSQSPMFLMIALFAKGVQNPFSASC